LTHLHCQSNNLNSLEEVIDIINLKELRCSENNLKLLEMGNLTNLEFFYCQNNNIELLKGIENCIGLEYFYCDNNNFSDEYKEHIRHFCKKNNINFII